MIVQWSAKVSFVFFLSCGLFIDVLGCPKVCECKWKYGKVWVICSNAKFIDVPQGLEPSTQVLDLSNNNLQILFRDAFIDRGLVNLQKVFLVNCKLRKLDEHCLRRLANLVELNLSYNLITEVPSSVLADVQGLRELRMKRNSLSIIPARAFVSVPDLVHLDLSFNAIESVHEDAFASLNELEVLKLPGNKLTTIAKAHFQPLSSLHELHLHANLWHCNCNLRSAIEWLNSQNLAFSALPKCWKPPQLSGVVWKDVNSEKLFCVPKVTPLASRILVTNGENVTLACKVETDAEAKVTWHVGNRPLINESQDAEGQRYNILEFVTTNNRFQTTVSNLTISEADFQDEGTYRCVVENEAGRAETNLTLRVSDVIREDPLVAPSDSYIAGAVVGGLGFVVLAMILCISLLVYRRGSQRAKKAKRNKVNFEENGEFVPPVRPESFCASDEGNLSSFMQISDKDEANIHPKTLEMNANKSFYRNFTNEMELQHSSNPSSRISYLKVGGPSLQLQPEAVDWQINFSGQYPDILLRSGKDVTSSTLSRRLYSGSVSQGGRKLQREQISRSSSCLHENTKTDIPHHAHSPWPVQPTHSLEALNISEGQTFMRRGSTPQLESGSNPCVVEGCSGDFTEGHKHRISAEQLRRILKEYSYMKEELRRLKERERERLREKEGQAIISSVTVPPLSSERETQNIYFDSLPNHHQQSQSRTELNPPLSVGIFREGATVLNPSVSHFQSARKDCERSKYETQSTNDCAAIQSFLDPNLLHESRCPNPDATIHQYQSSDVEHNPKCHSESRFHPDFKKDSNLLRHRSSDPRVGCQPDKNNLRLLPPEVNQAEFKL